MPTALVDNHDPSTGTGESASASASAPARTRVPSARPKRIDLQDDADQDGQGDVKMAMIGQEVKPDPDRVETGAAGDEEEGSASPRSDRAVRDDSILPAGGGREDDRPQNAETSNFGAGATDADLQRQASLLRISLSPPPSAHVPPPDQTDPEELAKLGPDPNEPRPVVKGAAAGEGEAGGVSREGVECEHDGGKGENSDGDESTEPQVGSPDVKDTREKGPGPGTGGKDDHCGVSEGIGVGMPKDRPTKASTAKKPDGESAEVEGSEGGSGRGSGSGSGSGSGGGYDASASAESSAPPATTGKGPDADPTSATKDSTSRSRSMAPEPEISPAQDERRSGSDEQVPTASKPRKQPKEGEAGGGMLPPAAAAAPASSAQHHRNRGPAVRHGKGRAEDGELAQMNEEEGGAGQEEGRGQSSAGPDDQAAAAVVPSPKRRPQHHLAVPSSNGKVEMMDPKTMRLVGVGTAAAEVTATSGHHVPAIGIGGRAAGIGPAPADAAKRQAEGMMSLAEAEAKFAAAA